MPVSRDFANVVCLTGTMTVHASERGGDGIVHDLAIRPESRSALHIDR
jgi:hypothetical protein